jgi:hypothetical protein
MPKIRILQGNLMLEKILLQRSYNWTIQHYHHTIKLQNVGAYHQFSSYTQAGFLDPDTDPDPHGSALI